MSIDPRETHERWAAEYRPLRYGASPYPDEWYFEQCGGCKAYKPIAGPLGEDWGACTQATSPADGTLRFEHDGCDAFVPDDTGDAPFV